MKQPACKACGTSKPALLYTGREWLCSKCWQDRFKTLPPERGVTT